MAFWCGAIGLWFCSSGWNHLCKTFCPLRSSLDSGSIRCLWSWEFMIGVLVPLAGIPSCIAPFHALETSPCSTRPWSLVLMALCLQCITNITWLIHYRLNKLLAKGQRMDWSTTPALWDSTMMMLALLGRCLMPLPLSLTSVWSLASSFAMKLTLLHPWHQWSKKGCEMWFSPPNGAGAMGVSLVQPRVPLPWHIRWTSSPPTVCQGVRAFGRPIQTKLQCSACQRHLGRRLPVDSAGWLVVVCSGALSILSY